jgi:MSHA pilin protein MshA
MKQQSGFTLIELIVVIVILGILAATALPKFADLSADARIAKMNGLAASLKSAGALAHASWLVSGSPTTPAGSVSVTMEGAVVPINFGYPDVGGDAYTNTATTGANSGIYLALGGAPGLSDYVITTPAATTITLSFTPDVNHASCVVSYTEPTGTNLPPTVLTTALTTANCG